MAPLPPKQNGIFKKILKCYDYKQYKMGIKLCKQILSNPETVNHGETLAMKGLILNCLGKKEEAADNIRKGLRNDLTSHVCWHVYGLLQRSEHKYDEAIKCYTNALKYDKENITILRDLSLLQIQMRDLDGFCDTRYKLFHLRSSQRISWISFAVAYHLLKDYETAAKVLEEYHRTQSQAKQNSNDKKPNSPADYEQSEILMYQVMIYQEAGNYKEALDFLTKHASEICDLLAVIEYKAELNLALGRKSAAATLINEQLLTRNQENFRYYELLEAASNINQNDEVARLQFYENIQSKYPSSQVPFKIPLSFVKDPQRFKQILDPYLMKLFRKALPALFRNLKPIYIYEYDKYKCEKNAENISKDSNLEDEHQINSSKTLTLDSYVQNSDKIQYRHDKQSFFEKYGLPPKLQIIQDLVLKYEHNLETNSSFESSEDSKDSENKTIILWVYYFLAQHYDFIGCYDKALNYVKLALEHTPTLIDLLMLKAKIYKHLNDPDKASEIMLEPPKLDTADRYLNSKSAKYLLRANKIAQAEETCAKFTRYGVPVTENLNEMQCMWFHIESANAYVRLKQFGKALKKCYEIDSFFSETIEDQFDFHTYCMRKMTLRAYIRLLRMEDVLRAHRFYFYAAEIAITIYLHLFDNPPAKESVGKVKNDAGSELTEAELKKLKNKERKAAAKQQNNKQTSNSKQNGDDGKQQKNLVNKSNENQANSNSNSNKNQSNDSSGDSNKNSYHLDPVALENPKDPLECAIRFLNPLTTLATEKIETHLLAFEIYLRKEKVLLMLQSVKRALNLDPDNRKLRNQLKTFYQFIEVRRKEGKLNDTVEKVLKLVDLSC